MPIILGLIFIRPFISSLAFPQLNFIFTVGLSAALITWFIYRRNQLILEPGLKNPVIFFCLALFLALSFSSDFLRSASQLYLYGCAVALLLAGRTFSEKEESWAINTLVAAACLVSILAIRQYFFGFSYLQTYVEQNHIDSVFARDYLHSRRVFFPFVTPGVLGGYLAMMAPLAFSGSRRFLKAGLLVCALLLTRSPAAIISLFFGVLVYLWLRGKLKKKGILLLAAILCLALAIFIWRSHVPAQHLRPSFSIMRRLEYWGRTLEAVRPHFLTGAGPGNFNLPNSRYAHNSYLQFLAEAGVIGICSLIWLLAAFLRKGLANIKQAADSQKKQMLAASVTVFLAHNIFDFTFFLPEVALIFWLILGLLAAQRQSVSR